MTWWQWVLTSIYAINGGLTYWKAINNKIVFYQDYTDAIRCAVGTITGVILIDMLLQLKLEYIDLFGVSVIVVFIIVFVLIWNLTYATTKTTNEGIDPADIWWIQVHKMLWSPFAALGVVRAQSLIFDSNRSASERMNGLYLLAVIIWIFNPLVNGDAVACMREEATADENREEKSA